MLYSKSAKYAVLALAEVALCQIDQAVSTKQIAESASVPYPLLAKIVAQLRRTGLVRATRGKSGGIQLARPAECISIKDVVIAMDGPQVLDDCPLFLTPCKCDIKCALHRLWGPARDAVFDFFESSTIRSVADARKAIHELSAVRK